MCWLGWDAMDISHSTVGIYMKPITRRDWALAMAAQAPDQSVYKIPEQRKPRSKNAQPEQALQINCCKLLRSLPNTLFFSVPNHLYLGGKMTGAKMNYIAKQKAAGMLPGVSDLVIVFRSVVGSTVIVLAELKVAGNTLSDHQQQFADRALAVGCVACVIHSIDELVTVLKNAGHKAFKQTAHA